MKVTVTAVALLFTAGIKTQNFTKKKEGKLGATLVGEPPLFSHKLLLLVTSTGFRSCQRETETRGHHVRGAWRGPVSGWGPLYCGELQINRGAEGGGMTGSTRAKVKRRRQTRE